MLSEAGLPHDDASYEGEQSTSLFSMDYYRDKARQFQAILNEVDATAQAAREAVDADLDPELTQGLLADLAQFDAKKAMFRAAAEGINAGAAIINSAGGRFPSLSIPTGLGALPFVIPAAAVAAIAVAATLITWGVSWIDGVKQRMLYAQAMGTLPPDKQAQLAELIVRADASQRASDESPLASVAGIIKWGALGLGAYLLWNAYTGKGARGLLK